MTYPVANEQQDNDVALGAAAHSRWVELRQQRHPRDAERHDWIQGVADGRRAALERRRVLVEEIERAFGDSCTIVGADAGMHLTVLMRARLHDQEVAAKAMRRKVLVSPLSLAYVGHAPQQGFVLGFGNADVAQIPGSVRLLRQCLGK